LNPFFGWDSIEVFAKRAQDNSAGIFIMVKSSNPSSADLQDLRVGRRSLYEVLARKVSFWGRGFIGKMGYSSIGAVVGATYPREARRVRAILRKNFLLIPGYGAQGATVEDLKGLFNSDGLGAIVTASRSIIYAYSFPSFKGKNWWEAIQEAASSAKDAINQIRAGI
jgi:orotidine-5'-phosphate decarboxylase